jgi:hypothetical protein
MCRRSPHRRRCYQSGAWVPVRQWSPFVRPLKAWLTWLCQSYLHGLRCYSILICFFFWYRLWYGGWNMEQLNIEGNKTMWFVETYKVGQFAFPVNGLFPNYTLVAIIKKIGQFVPTRDLCMKSATDLILQKRITARQCGNYIYRRRYFTR